jgi:hypothetical protein
VARPQDISVETIRASLEKVRLFASDAVLSAFNEAAHDDDLWERASRDPRQFLLDRNIDVPEELAFAFGDEPIDPPSPDFPLIFGRWEITGWRTVWICGHADLDDRPGPRTCEQITLPIFARRRPL